MDPLHDPPWSIPIREPGPDVPQRAATWVDRMPLAPMVAASVGLLLLLVFALPALESDAAEPEPEVLGSVAPSETMIRPAPEPAEPVTSSVPTTTEGPTTTSSSTTVAAVQEDGATTRAATSGGVVDPEPAGLPIHTPGDLGDGWVAQVSSVPASAGGAALSRSYETVRRSVPDAIVVRGSEWPSLRRGFWVIVGTGHDDAASAVAACEAWGFAGKDDCFARYLSADDATQRTCWRDESGSLAGTCR
jgi:hypothetical protein